MTISRGRGAARRPADSDMSKLDGRVAEEASLTRGSKEEEREFRRNLLHHVIFQQVLTLTRLDGREQALQIIAACRR